jgi:hypothetical protein
MSFVGSNILAGASGQGGAGYAIERSLRFNSGDSAYLNRTPSAAGNRKTWTWSGWVKLVDHVNQSFIFGAAGGFQIYHSAGKIYLDGDASVSSSNYWTFATSRVFRDPSAWYHFVFVHDTTEAAANDRFKIYVNGDQLTEFSSNNRTNFTQNYEGYVNNNVEHRIGRQPGTSVYCNCYLADVHFIDGQALAATDFGETDDNGVWQPKAYTGNYNISNITYSNYLSAPSGFASGEGATNAFDGSTSTRTKVAVADSIITFDLSSLNLTGSFEFYATNAASEYSLDGGTTWTSSAANSYTTATSDISGVSNIKLKSASGTTMKVTAFKNQGFVLVDNSGTNSFHLDFKDNSSNAALGTDTSGNSNTWTVNNLSAGAGSNPTAKQNFDVVTYTGTGSSQSISSLAFQPDFVWIKARNASYNHVLFDSVRGTGGAKVLFSNDTSAEGGSSGQEGTVYGHVSAFNSNGFTVAAGTGTPLWVSNSGTNYIAWAWKAGGAASSNTDGTITSSVSANDAYGFSIATFVGTGSNASFGHGLSTSPKFVIVKDRSSAYGWTVWHTALTGGEYIVLNSVNAKGTSAAVWNSTVPSSSVISVGTDVGTNKLSDNYVCYSWSEVAGFSKFGTFTHSGSASSVTGLGFKPRFILVKDTNVGEDWRIFDSARGSSTALYPNTGGAEGSGWAITFNDDGFSWISGSFASGTYIYAAFAATVPADPDGDSLVDTPTNVTASTGGDLGGVTVGNYATFNPLDAWSSMSFSNGNLQMTDSGNGGDRGGFLTIGPTADKFYWEITFTAVAGENYIGLAKKGRTQSSSDIWSGGGDAYMYYSNGNKLGQGNGGGGQSYGASWTANDVMGVAVDWTNGSITFYKNGVSQGVAFSGQDLSEYMPAVYFNTNQSATVVLNAGQRAFSYPVSGYKALCTSNLPEPTIADGSKYFDTIIASGTGASKTFTMPGGFGPGLVWAKQRNGATNHALFDVLRGATKRLVSNANQAEDTQANQLSAFTSDGFTYGSDIPNASGNAGVYWAWDAGSSNTTIAAGSLNSSSYDQSQTWSTYGTFTGTNHTDYDWLGVFGASDVWDGLGSLYLTSNSGKWTLSSPIACSSGVKFYVHGNYSITINEGLSDEITQSSTGGANYHYFTIPFSGNIASIKSNTSYAYLMRIFVDGLALIDSGISINTPSIASTVRANPTAGFSIIKWDGDGSAGTLATGLSSVDFIITKCAGQQADWAVWTSDFSDPTSYLSLNSTSGSSLQPTVISGAPTGGVVPLGSNGNYNTNMIMYAMSAIPGYSAFGSYTGNGSADGPFVYTGFRPKWLMWKVTQTTPNSQSWYVLDTARDPYNESTNRLHPNSTATDAAMGTGFDLLSNGFKLRSSDTDLNGAYTYIYAAFAENPFKTARAR